MQTKLTTGKKPTKKELEEMQELQKRQVAENEHRQYVAGLINQWADENTYFVDNISFSNWVQKAFEHFSAIILRMPEDMYLDIVKVTNCTYTVHQMDMLLQVLNTANSSQMNFVEGMWDYILFRKRMQNINADFLTYLNEQKQRIKDENSFIYPVPTAQA